jgi:hypothetical protein
MISWPLGNLKFTKFWLDISLAKKLFGKARYEWEGFRKGFAKEANLIELVHNKVSVVFLSAQ